jgi:hypothetical protein
VSEIKAELDTIRRLEIQNGKVVTFFFTVALLHCCTAALQVKFFNGGRRQCYRLGNGSAG